MFNCTLLNSMFSASTILINLYSWLFPNDLKIKKPTITFTQEQQAFLDRMKDLGITNIPKKIQSITIIDA